MTFSTLAKKIMIIPSQPVNKIQLFRDAENDFIERTLCVESFTEITMDGSSHLNDVPSGFIQEHRVTWEGDKLEKIPQYSNITIHDIDENPYTGTPAHYWIENEDFHIIPKPACSGTLGVWYTAYNSDSSSASPTIPTIEQLKLVNYVTAMMLEAEGQDARADRYWAKYETDIAMTRIKYLNQRFAQGGVLYDKPTSYTNTARYGVATVNNESEYIWKKVQVSGHDEYPPTEQTFTTGTSPLTASLLDSPQTSLPIFRSSNTHVVEITTAYQDRTCFLSTEPTISGDNITFGLTLSEAGLETPCYYDIKLIVSQ